MAIRDFVDNLLSVITILTALSFNNGYDSAVEYSCVYRLLEVVGYSVFN